MKILSATLPLLAGLGWCTATAPGLVQGYVDADLVRIGAPGTGRLEWLAVTRGDRVAAGAPLFALDPAIARATRDAAAARLAQAEAQLADLRKGRRPEELAVIAAQRAQAETALRLDQSELRRQQELAAAKVASPQRLDEARAAVERDQARMRELEAQLDAARLGARPDEIAAAAATVALRQAELAEAAARLADLAPIAPAEALVEDVLFRPGEMVPAGTPVVSLLPPDNVKLLFFVPETRLGEVAVGDQVGFRCDGCPEGQRAVIAFIAAQPEFTPPVIYSIGNREKLVFRVEARPQGDPARLHPGQPIDIELQTP